MIEYPAEVLQAAREADDAAMTSYYAENPRPEPTDFECPSCKAAPGEPCHRQRRSGDGPHKVRSNRAWSPREANQRRASHAGDQAHEGVLRTYRSTARALPPVG